VGLVHPLRLARMLPRPLGVLCSALGVRLGQLVLALAQGAMRHAVLSCGCTVVLGCLGMVL
jgi:hypothetical protein